MGKQVRLAVIGVMVALAVFGVLAGGYVVARKTILKPQTQQAAGGVLPGVAAERVGNYALTIASQQDGATIASPLTVRGTGTVPQGQTVVVRLRDSAGNEIATASAAFNGGYSTSLSYTAPAGVTNGQLEVIALDTQTGVPVAGQAVLVKF